MPHPIYRLSNRQRKELYVRRAALCIAIPIDSRQWSEVTRESLAWAGKFLPDVDETIQAAEVGTVDVVRPLRAGKTPDSLTEALGAIATDGPGYGDVTNEWQQVVSVRVLVVWLSHGDIRHQAARPQWPANIIVNGEPVFGEPQKTETA